jgi:four helix bundle protein
MKYDLEDRLVDFSVLVLTLAEHLPDTRTCNHLGGQAIRSCTCPALTYGEAQSAESKRDFLHKMKVSLKELRETRINLKIVLKKKCLKDETLLQKALTENNELISIFVKSISTASRNSQQP